MAAQDEQELSPKPMLFEQKGPQGCFPEAQLEGSRLFILAGERMGGGEKGHPVCSWIRMDLGLEFHICLILYGFAR